MEGKRELNAIEKGDIYNYLLRYQKAINSDQRYCLRYELYEYIEQLIKEGVER